MRGPAPSMRVLPEQAAHRSSGSASYRIGGEPSTDRAREASGAEPELQTGELAELVDDGIRKPAPVPGVPEPGQLLARVPCARPPQGRARLVPFHVRVLGRDARVEEAPERRAHGVRVRMADGGTRLVDERVPVAEDAPRPLLVLAHGH